MKRNIIIVLLLFFIIFGIRGVSKNSNLKPIETNVSALSVVDVNNELQDSVVLNLVDSMQNKNYCLMIETEIKCQSDVAINPKNNKLTPESFYKCKLSPQQTIKFKKDNKIIKQISKQDIFDTIFHIKGWNLLDIDSYVEQIHLLKGTEGDLYLIWYSTVWNGMLLSLYDMQGELLWYEFTSKQETYKSGNYNQILRKYGITKEKNVFDKNEEFFKRYEVLTVFY
ncbi:MAG: hypothetical protein FWD60_05780 [Candidatus Azobacteroides sp.]|nr:hypothetical protein [Candidatus Azobacteroides sp.]